MIFASVHKVSGEVVYAMREAVPVNPPTNTIPAGLLIERRDDIVTMTNGRLRVHEQWAVVDIQTNAALVIMDLETDAEKWAVAELERRAPEKGHSGPYGLGKEEPLWWR